MLQRPYPVGLLVAAVAVATAGGRAAADDAKVKGQPSAAKIKKLIDDLDNKNFQLRQAAEHELEALEQAALPALDAAIKTAPSLELSRRIETLSARIRQMQFDRVVQQIEVLRDGATVEYVADGTAFHKAGLREADQILTIDGTDVACYGDLRRFLHGKTIGGKVKLFVRRGDQRLTLTVHFERP
jgi:S1-C subfamily serine protease